MSNYNEAIKSLFPHIPSLESIQDALEQGGSETALRILTQHGYLNWVAGEDLTYQDIKPIAEVEGKK